MGAKIDTNAGARSGTGKIRGSFILFERAPRRGDDQSLRGCCRESFEHEALLDLLGGAGTGQSGAQHPPRLLPKHKVVPKERYSSHRAFCALWSTAMAAQVCFALVC